MTMPTILFLLAAAAGLLVILLIIAGAAQGLTRTASAPARVKSHHGTRPHAHKPPAAKAHTNKAAARIASKMTAKTAASLTTAEPAKAAAGKQGKDAFTGLAVVGGLVAVIGGIASFIADANDGDIQPDISEIRAGALHGTMVNARNSNPVVLIVPGSGPTDRDGNSPAGLKTDAYRLLADALIEERISTVRVDKRGMFASRDAGDPNAVTPADYVADIHAWIDAIKADRGEGSGCVFLLGHSEGALMVSLAAAGRDDVCGMILVAGMGRKMADVIREQLRANPANAPILDEALAALAELEAGRHVDVTNMTPALLPLFAQQVQDYLISVLNVDPVEAVRRAGKETLIIQGNRDLQVSEADARLLDAAPKTDLRIIDGMNHVLKAAPEDRAGNLATYTEPGLPLADDLVRRIRRFVKDND